MEGLRLWTRRLMRANELNPDPNTSLVITTAATLGLLARQRTGIGQKILVDMFGANAQANHDDFFSYAGKPQRALPDAQLLGLAPTYRLYHCADDHWVFLALVTEREKQQFTTTLANEGIEPPEITMLRAGDNDTVEALTTLFLSRPAAFWADLLGRAGIGCVQADGPIPSRFWLEDPQARAIEATSRTQHPAWGTYQRHGALVRFGRGAANLKPPPQAGQHNGELLSGLGYDAADIARLEAEGVIWQER